MGQSNIPVTSGSGNTVDTWTTTSNQKRQGIVVADPSVDAAVAGVVSADPGPSSTAYGQIVRLAGSAQVQIAGSSGSIGVYFDRGNPSVTVASFTGSVGVYFDRANPSVNVGTPTIASITNTVGVYFDRANPSVNVGTPTVASITNTVGVYFDRSNPSVNVGTPTITAITNTVGVYFDRSNPSVNIGTPTITSITNTVGVYFDRGNPTVTANAGTGTMTVTFDSSRGFLQGINTSIGIYFDRGNPSVAVSNFSGIGNTASIFTVSSSYGGNALAGATIISPSANYSFKIFAFSLSTTAQSNIFAKFTNGASSSPTEYWRVALQAPSAGISGANLAVTPPGHLWATGTSTTLSLVLDSASLVHYSVSYIKETS